MNVPDTQNSLFRQMDAAALVSTLQSAADQAQRQAALSNLRAAQHKEASVQGLPESDASLGVEGGDQDEEARQRRGRRLPGTIKQDAATPVKDAPHPGPLGRHFDTIG
jgi:hypothetical protein